MSDFNFDCVYNDIGVDITLIGARDEFDNHLKIYDDSIGPLFLYRDSLGIVGIVRASDWHTAFEIVYDNFLPPIKEDEIPEAYGFWLCEKEGQFIIEDESEYETYRFASDSARQDYLLKVLMKDRDLAEGYAYQSNATGTGIVSYDLNGESLDRLTQEMVNQFELTLEIEQD